MIHTKTVSAPCCQFPFHVSPYAPPNSEKRVPSSKVTHPVRSGTSDYKVQQIRLKSKKNIHTRRSLDIPFD